MGGGKPLPSAANEQLPEGENLSGFLIPTLKRPTEALGDGQLRNFLDLRHKHDKQRKNPAGYPPSGRKKPEQPFLVLSTPRRKDVKAKPSGKYENTEISSWNCACT
jgi:hypothetical protein